MLETSEVHDVILFTWVYTLGGAENKLDSIWNYTVFLFIAEHCIGKLELEISGEEVYWYS